MNNDITEIAIEIQNLIATATNMARYFNFKKTENAAIIAMKVHEIEIEKMGILKNRYEFEEA